MERKEALLSILMPTYNRVNFAKTQLDFILRECAEEREKIEIVVSDNASEDGTKEMLEQYRDKGIIVNRNNSNLGIVANMYVGSQFCSGKYLWIFSDDDIVKPGAIKHVIQLLNKYQDINYIFLNYASLKGKALEDGLYPSALRGESGYFENAVPMIMRDFSARSENMILITTSIYKKEYFELATKVLPLCDLESYAVNYYTPLAAVKNGSAYFDEEIWCNNFPMNASWRRDAYRSKRGVMRFFVRLDRAGYSKKEIKKMYLSFCNRGFMEGCLIYNLFKTGNVRIFIEDWYFLFKQIPIKMIGLSVIGGLRVFKDTIVRVGKGQWKKADYNDPSRFG